MEVAGEVGEGGYGDDDDDGGEDGRWGVDG
jgi:hypothetical protein